MAGYTTGLPTAGAAAIPACRRSTRAAGKSRNIVTIDVTTTMDDFVRTGREISLDAPLT